MWRFIKRKQAQPADAEGERSDLSEDGRQWVWSSCAPAFRRILAAVVGPRTCVSAVPLMQMTAAGGLGVPCFFRDGSRCSLSALIAGYHT